jgi:transcriptional regulator with XRE-family HTH domain
MRPKNLRLRLLWADLLRDARVDAGLTQRELRDILNGDGGPLVSPEVLSRWENAVYSPSDENRLRLAVALGKTVPELFPYYLGDPTNGDEAVA